MPISASSVLPYIIREALQIQPKKVLDVGIGNGIYGALIYNYATVMLNEIPELHGIEPWEGYRNPMWDLYHIYSCSLQEFDTDHRYDLILVMDVIEHMELAEGAEQIEKLQGMLSPGGVLVVSTPAVFIEQGAYGGNEYETHRSLWTHMHFQVLGLKPIPDYKGNVFGEHMLVYKYKRPKTGG